VTDYLFFCLLSSDFCLLTKIEAPATQGRSQLGAGASRLRAAGGDSTCAGRFTASQWGRAAENQIYKEPLGVERRVRRPLNSHFVLRSISGRIFMRHTRRAFVQAFNSTELETASNKNHLSFSSSSLWDARDRELLPARHSKIFRFKHRRARALSAARPQAAGQSRKACPEIHQRRWRNMPRASSRRRRS